jgi:hypothetical protein
MARRFRSLVGYQGDHLRGFYFDSCGFRPTQAGLIAL